MYWNYGKINARRIFKNLDEIEERIDEYFKECKKIDRSPTVSGLSLYLGFTDRQSLLNYIVKDYKDKKGREMSSCIKRAKAFIEEYNESKLSKGDGNQVGRIFVLKNGFNWRDKMEVDQTIRGELSLTDVLSGGNKEKEKDDDKE